MNVRIKKSYLSYLVKGVSLRKKLKVIWWNLHNHKITAPYPLRIQVELDRRCNLDCQMCYRKKLKHTNKRLTMPEFREILDKVKGTVCEMEFHGWGESMLNPDFFDMLQLAKDEGILLNVLTNGTKLNEENINRLVELAPERINISIDGTAEVYEEIRQGGDYNTLMTSLIRLIHEFKKREMKTKFVFYATIGAYNIGEIPKLVLIKNVLGFDYISFSTLLSFQEHGLSTSDNDILIVDRDRFEKYRNMYGQDMYGQKTDVAFVQADRYRTCIRPKMNAFIDVVGDIYPCGCIVGMIEPLGNIHDIENFGKFYRSEIYNKFREESLTGEIEACRKCENWGEDVSRI